MFYGYLHIYITKFFKSNLYINIFFKNIIIIKLIFRSNKITYIILSTVFLKSNKKSYYQYEFYIF